MKLNGGDSELNVIIGAHPALAVTKLSDPPNPEPNPEPT